MEEAPSLPLDVLQLGRRLIPRPAFLLGCARSGTSILGEAIAAHPDVAYLFEVSPLWDSLTPERDDHRLVSSDATPQLAAALYEDLSAACARTHQEGAVLLEKNPKHVLRLPFLYALFPHARFIHILRDGRDVTASLMFRNRGPTWSHLQIPGWRELLQRYERANHVRCAHQWRAAVSTARRDAEALPREQYHELRFEDLVRNPPAAAGAILEFLKLPPDPAVDSFLEKIQDETRGSYHAKKQVRHYVDNHSRRIGRYAENLSTPQQEEVVAVLGGLLAELGYDEEHS